MPLVSGNNSAALGGSHLKRIFQKNDIFRLPCNKKEVSVLRDLFRA